VLDAFPVHFVADELDFLVLSSVAKRFFYRLIEHQKERVGACIKCC